MIKIWLSLKFYVIEQKNGEINHLLQFTDGTKDYAAEKEAKIDCPKILKEYKKKHGLESDGTKKIPEKKQLQHPNVSGKLTYARLIMSCWNHILMKVTRNILVLDKDFGTSNAELARF